jgi:hypothetical protein
MSDSPEGRIRYSVCRDELLSWLHARVRAVDESGAEHGLSTARVLERAERGFNSMRDEDPLHLALHPTKSLNRDHVLNRLRLLTAQMAALVGVSLMSKPGRVRTNLQVPVSFVVSFGY